METCLDFQSARNSIPLPPHLQKVERKAQFTSRGHRRFAIFFLNKWSSEYLKKLRISREQSFAWLLCKWILYKWLLCKFSILNGIWLSVQYKLGVTPLTQISSSNSSHARNLSHRLPGNTQDDEEHYKSVPNPNLLLKQCYESVNSCDQLPSPARPRWGTLQKAIPNSKLLFYERSKVWTLTVVNIFNPAKHK